MRITRAGFILVLFTPISLSVAQTSKNDLTALKLTSELCLHALSDGKTELARRFADESERAYRTILTADSLDVTASVGLARLLGECRSPLRAQAAVLDVYYEGIRLLQHALRVDSSNFGARFTLAQFYFNGPAKHHNDAVHELETLIQRHGHRGDLLEMASAFLMLGDLLFRENRRDDALSVWERGQKLYPHNARFRYRVDTSP